MTSSVIQLIGDTDGVNTTFTTPTQYLPTTLRVVWNGALMEPDDDKWGWTEIDVNTIELTTAPRAGDIIAAFYREESVGGQLDDVVGSPFHPNNVYP